MQYTIQNEKIKLTADTFGGEIVSLEHNGRQMLWQDASIWGGHAPILFPICGNCQVWLEGKHYQQNRHGFARTSAFELVCQTQDSLTFELSANQDTLAVFPFNFTFVVTYAINKDTLSICYTIKNNGDKPLPFSCGGHESFALDDDLANYHLVFDKAEKFDSLCHNDDGRLNGKSVSYGNGNKLHLTHQQLDNHSTVIFGDVNSRKVTLAKQDGASVAEITFDGFANLLLWSPDGKNCVCIEPWLNLPDNQTNFNVEFCNKQGVYVVPPQGEKTLARTIKYC